MKQTSPKGFSYIKTKDGRILIYKDRRHIMTHKTGKAADLLTSLDGCSAEEEQMILAIETGQFKFGNEKEAEAIRKKKGR